MTQMTQLKLNLAAVNNSTPSFVIETFIQVRDRETEQGAQLCRFYLDSHMTQIYS